MNNNFESMTNQEYHSNKSHLSSSNLKTLLMNPTKFYEEKICGNKVNEQKAVYDVGSLTHAVILEPHKVETDFAIFPGLRKAGAKYEEFKAANAGKIILSISQKLQVEKYCQAYSSHKTAVGMLSGGFAEHTMTSEILGVPVKARADYINVNSAYIADIKTTSHPSDSEIFRMTVQEYMYSLSASLYCQIAFNNYGKLFDFYFVVISKVDLTCEIYKASSATLSEGSALVTQALVLYKKCKESGVWLHEQPKRLFDSEDYEIVEV